MSDDINDVEMPTAGTPSDENRAVPAPREPWATPRVLASEPFGITNGPPDGEPVEGSTPGYGPFS